MRLDADDNGRLVVHDGRMRSVVCAVAGAKSPARDYLRELHAADRSALHRFLVLFERMAEDGVIRNKTQFRKLEGCIWEFKRGQHRMLCFQDDRTFVLTHGFRKKRQKCPRTEIERARRIMSEDMARIGRRVRRGRPHRSV